MEIKNGKIETKLRKRKRVFDTFFAIIALIISFPIMLAVAILIKIMDPKGPVLFYHQRIGRQGKLFYCIKFRSMCVNAEKILEEWLESHPKIRDEYLVDFKLKNDPRIIPGIGNFLRKTSLDELPQFFNILKGEMSVVGPRPIVVKEIEKYGESYNQLIRVKPGLTGLWQVSGRNDTTYGQRVSLDNHYIESFSIFSDIEIVAKTVFVMIFRRGAY